MASRMRATRARERPSCAWELYLAASKARESRPWRRGTREGGDHMINNR